MGAGAHSGGCAEAVANRSESWDSSEGDEECRRRRAGPGGLIAARWLLSQGFEPTIFEQGQMLGGQWTGVDGNSGVWPAMYTNAVAP
jgi:hypothetical protein